MTMPEHLITYDLDDCPKSGHLYDDDCNWRSTDEREAFPHVARGIHVELIACHHSQEVPGSLCGDLAWGAIDALYENGLAVRRA